MDTLSHALWGNGLFGYKRHWKLAIFFGAFPDLISFGVLFIVKLFNGSLTYSGPPTLESLKQLQPYPDWLLFMDSLSHSFVTAFLIIGIVYFYKKELVWPMLAWPFHIVLDIFTHSIQYFPTPVLWPISNYRFDGIPWSHPIIWFANIACIAMIFIYRRKY